MTESYIGDGLFASFDGLGITLRAPRESGDHFVYLEPEVMRDFLLFACSLPIEATVSWRLSDADSRKFIDTILNSPEPNDALKSAAERYIERRR